MANELTLQIDEITKKIACTQDIESKLVLYEERIELESERTKLLLKESEKRTKLLLKETQQLKLELASREPCKFLSTLSGEEG